jgi:glycoprotein endo-alpha-1,2-mannosidase
MYDLSGMQDEDWVTVINDWKHLVNHLHLTSGGNKQTYLYHNAKPLVALWGVGFQNREYHTAAVERIIDFLKNDPEYGNCSILLGVPENWREQSDDAETDPHLLDVLRKSDIIHPWFVGRYNEQSYSLFQKVIQQDIAWTNANHIDYAPTVFPGFSWHNMYSSGPLNQIPRNKGNFFWAQLSGAINMGCQMLYIAMFDEIDEGTAIFKTSKTPPTGKSKFVTIESEIPNDY